jgi:hypothetical protein
MRILIDYPYQEPVLLDDADGELWFGKQTGEEYDCIWSTGHQANPGDKGAERLLVIEPPAVQPWAYEEWFRNIFEGVLAFAGPMLDHVVEFHHPLPLGWPELPDHVNCRPWDERRDAVIAIMGNKHSVHPRQLYSERVRVLDELHDAGIRVDCYGRPGFQGKPWFRGELTGGAAEKRAKLSEYRYALCMENCVCRNYLTEKLPEAVLAGCIPIYHGPPNVSDWPLPFNFIVAPGGLPHHVCSTAEQHEHYLFSIDPGAIREAMSCRKLFQQIRSLSA